MKKNIGPLDRAVRIVLGLVLIALFLTKVVTGVIAIIVLVLSIILLVTGIVGFCPAYYPFGFNTLFKRKSM